MSGVTKIGGATYTFPMPADDVTVYAEFGEASSVPDPFDLALGDNTVTVVGEKTPSAGSLRSRRAATASHPWAIATPE